MVEKGLAYMIVKSFAEQNGPKLSILEAMSMELVKSDGYEMYAIQRGNVTFLAWVCRTTRRNLNGERLNRIDSLRTKTVFW